MKFLSGLSQYLSIMFELKISVLSSSDSAIFSLLFIVLILASGQPVFIYKVPGNVFLSHNSGKHLYTYS